MEDKLFSLIAKVDALGHQRHEVNRYFTTFLLNTISLLRSVHLNQKLERDFYDKMHDVLLPTYYGLKKDSLRNNWWIDRDNKFRIHSEERPITYVNKFKLDFLTKCLVLAKDLSKVLKLVTLNKWQRAELESKINMALTRHSHLFKIEVGVIRNKEFVAVSSFYEPLFRGSDLSLIYSKIIRSPQKNLKELFSMALDEVENVVVVDDYNERNRVHKNINTWNFFDIQIHLQKLKEGLSLDIWNSLSPSERFLLDYPINFYMRGFKVASLLNYYWVTAKKVDNNPYNIPINIGFDFFTGHSKTQNIVRGRKRRIIFSTEIHVDTPDYKSGSLPIFDKTSLTTYSWDKKLKPRLQAMDIGDEIILGTTSEVIEDYEPQKRDDIRMNFIGQVTHGLKTPLPPIDYLDAVANRFTSSYYINGVIKRRRTDYILEFNSIVTRFREDYSFEFADPQLDPTCYSDAAESTDQPLGSWPYNPFAPVLIFIESDTYSSLSNKVFTSFRCKTGLGRKFLVRSTIDIDTLPLSKSLSFNL